MATPGNANPGQPPLRVNSDATAQKLRAAAGDLTQKGTAMVKAVEAARAACEKAGQLITQTNTEQVAAGEKILDERRELDVRRYGASRARLRAGTRARTTHAAPLQPLLQAEVHVSPLLAHAHAWPDVVPGRD